MFPDDESFPFKLIDGELWQFKKTGMRWCKCIGTKDNIGYMVASWGSKPNRRFMKVHSIVWRCAHGPVPAGLEIDHIDMDKANNRLDNLRLVTHAENLAYARSIKGNWAKSKLLPHQRALTIAMPSDACWAFWAERWGVHKNSLLNIRAQSKK